MTQTNVGEHDNKQTQMNIAYPGGDFLVSLGQKTEQRLFGGTAIQSRNKIGECIVVLGGDVQAHFTARIPAIGIVLTIPKVNDLEEAIVVIAKQLVQAAGKVDGVNAEQLYRIALEYTAQAAALSPTQIESWEQYIPVAIQLRQAFSIVNAAAEYATEQAFSKKDAQRAVQNGIKARKAWGEGIQALLQQSPHLATFRAEIDLPLMFTDTAAWLHLAGMQADNRKATIAQLVTMIAQSGNPLVTEVRVQQAADRVQGLQRLSHGNRNGITPQAFINAAAQGRFAEQKDPNGGQITTLSGVQLQAFGEMFRGMHGVASVTTEAKPDGTVQINANVRENGQREQVFVPTFPKGTQQPYAQA